MDLSSFAWPAAVALIVLAVVLLFRPNVARLIDRTSTLKLPGGVQADLTPNPQVQSHGESPLRPEGPALETTERLGSPPLMDVYRPLEEELKTRIEQSVPDKQFHYAWALRMYAIAAMEKAHEANYRQIIGSQIRALRHINQSNGSCRLADLRVIFSETAALYPKQFENFSFEAWLSFMVQCSYVVTAGQHDDSLIALTDVGRNFLIWMAAVGVQDFKPF